MTSEDASAQHVKDLSFTHAGHAYQHPTEGFEDGPVYVIAKDPNSKPYKKTLVEDPPDGCAKSRFSVALTYRESLPETPSGLRTFALVGA
jgi:hypothetical protein